MIYKVLKRPVPIKERATGVIVWLWRTGGYDAEHRDYGRCSHRASAAKIIRNARRFGR